MTEMKFKQLEYTTTEYLTVEECIRRNGHRHLERAIAYASAGYEDIYFEGSMKKALKQYAKADLFKTPEWMVKAYGHKLVDLADKIADDFTKRIDIDKSCCGNRYTQHSYSVE